MTRTGIGMWKGLMWDGFPNFQNASTASTNASSTSQNINMPSGIAVGDLLIAILTIDNGTTLTFPAGWTAFATDNDAANIGMRAAYRIADGTEGASITVTAGSAGIGESVCLRFNHALNAQPDRATGTNTGTSTPDPPSLNLTGGLPLNAYWLTVVARLANNAPSSYPTNYTLDQNSFPHSSALALTISGRKLNAASENPPNYTFPSSTRCVFFTIGIKPA